MSDISVTIGQRETYQVNLGQGILPHSSSHAPGGSDSIEEYYYPRSNPSGYAQSGDFATVQYVDGVSGSLYSQISFPENVVFTTGGQTINGAKSFSTRPTVNGSGVLLVGEIAAVETGYLTGYVSKEETGVYSTVFYPRNNPSGYITGVDLSNYQTVVSSTGISGYLQEQILVINSSTGIFVTQSQTGQFYPINNPSGFVTGVDLSPYQTVASSIGISGYLQAQIIVLNGQTGSYALAINTGSFLTTGAADNRYVNVLGDTVSGDLVVTGSTSGQSFVLQQGGYIDFQGGAPTHREGRIFYDTDAHTLCYFNDEADVTVNVGQENIVRVSNGWTGTLLNGQVVYASGAQGNRPKVFPASASDSNVSRHDVLGVATHDISDQGYITTAGLVNGLNTTGFLEGDTVYLSMETGLFSAQMPVAPNHAIKIGIITRSHQTQGQLFVDIDQGAHLNYLHDVRITGVQNNDLFRYNSTSGYWENFQSDFITGDVVRPNETGSFLTSETDPIFTASTAYSINSTLTGEWGESYRDSITGINIAGTSSKTITLYQRDGTTLTANFTDIEGTGDGGTDYFLTGASFNSGDGNLSLYVNNGSVITESFDGRYVTGNVVRSSETGDFLISSSLSNYQTIVGSTGISGYLQGQINSIDLSPTGSFLTTGAGDGRYYPLSSNPSSYLIAADIANLASTGYVTGVSGHLQSQISAIDLSNLESATGNLNVRVSAIENVSGDFALKTNTGAFLTTGAGDSRYYPLFSNPSSYLVESDITHLASTGYVTGVSGHLQTQITSISDGTGNFVSSSQTGQFYTIDNPSGFITGIDLSNYATIPFVTGVSGYHSGLIAPLYAETGSYALSVNTGSFLTTGAGDGRYYPLSSNPSNYLVAADLADYATTGYVTGVSGYLQDQIASIDLSSLQAATFDLNVRLVEVENLTGDFITTGTSGYFQSQITDNYNSSITGIGIAGSDTKTITLYQQDGGTLSANFTDLQGTGGSVSDVVYLTGDQNISGVKNFISRPTVNSSYVSLSGESFVRELYIDAGAMTTGVSGASPTGFYFGVADIAMDSYVFDSAANTYAQFKLTLPESLETGSLRAKFHWTANNGGTGHVLWGVQARSASNDGAISGSWGASQEILDQFITGYDHHLSSPTSQISTSNTLYGGDLIFFRVYRNAASATDTLAVNALLNGVSVQYSTTGSSNQW